jgi:DNA-binding transcriptional LysR family regulator
MLRQNMARRLHAKIVPNSRYLNRVPGVPVKISAVTLKQIRAFLYVVEEGSFTRAAERLFLSQSALTALIQQLEEVVDLPLLERTTRRVSLSQAGEQFHPIARRLVVDLDAALSDLASVAALEYGTVGIAAAPSVVTLILPQLIADFSARYPGIRCYIKDDTSAAVQQAVLRREVDIGFTSKWSDDPDLVFTPCLIDRFGIVCPAQHPLAKKKEKIKWTDLAEYRCVGLSNDTGIRTILREKTELPPSVASPFYEVSSTTGLEALVSAGLGISVLPALAAQRQPLGDLSFRELHNPSVERVICLITHRQRTLSHAASSFLELAVSRINHRKFPQGVRAA